MWDEARIRDWNMARNLDWRGRGTPTAWLLLPQEPLMRLLEAAVGSRSSVELVRLQNGGHTMVKRIDDGASLLDFEF